MWPFAERNQADGRQVASGMVGNGPMLWFRDTFMLRFPGLLQLAMRPIVKGMTKAAADTDLGPERPQAALTGPRPD